MAALIAQSPLRALADILYFACTLGHDAWNGGSGASGDAASSQLPPKLSGDLLDLFVLLRKRGVSGVLVGGVALLKYVEGRNTEDIDLVIAPDSLDLIPEISIISRDRDFARGRFGALRVDLLLTANPVFKLVHERHVTTHAFAELEVRCATVEGLLILKLYALPSLYRQGDGQRIALYESDITMLMERYRPPIAPLLDAVRPHLDEGAVNELSNIVGDIERRIGRMDQAKDRTRG